MHSSQNHPRHIEYSKGERGCTNEVQRQCRHTPTRAPLGMMATICEDREPRLAMCHRYVCIINICVTFAMCHVVSLSLCVMLSHSPNVMFAMCHVVSLSLCVMLCHFAMYHHHLCHFRYVSCCVINTCVMRMNKR